MSVVAPLSAVAPAMEECRGQAPERESRELGGARDLAGGWSHQGAGRESSYFLGVCLIVCKALGI